MRSFDIKLFFLNDFIDIIQQLIIVVFVTEGMRKFLIEITCMKSLHFIFIYTD